MLAITTYNINQMVIKRLPRLERNLWRLHEKTRASFLSEYKKICLYIAFPMTY